LEENKVTALGLHRPPKYRNKMR